MDTQEAEKINKQTDQNHTRMSSPDGNGGEEKKDPTGHEEILLVNEDKISEMQLKIDELNDKYLRLYSEFDNFRKRSAKEKIEFIQAAGEDVFKSLLPTIDDFERAIKSNAEITDIKVITDGMNLIYNKLKNTLSKKGLEEMKSIGETFNTDLHEAVTNIPAPSEDLKGKVIEEHEKGYTLNGKVIRFSKVVIGS